MAVTYKIRHKGEELKQESKEAFALREEILLAERIVLQTLNFDFAVEHPYKSLLQSVRNIKGNRNLAQVAWNFVNDSLRTTLCLQYRSQLIASAAIYLASKFLKYALPEGKDKKPWYEVLDANIHDLEDISNQILDLYESSPNVMAIKAPGSGPSGANGDDHAATDTATDSASASSPTLLKLPAMPTAPDTSSAANMTLSEFTHRDHASTSPATLSPDRLAAMQPPASMTAAAQAAQATQAPQATKAAHATPPAPAPSSAHTHPPPPPPASSSAHSHHAYPPSARTHTAAPHHHRSRHDGPADYHSTGRHHHHSAYSGHHHHSSHYHGDVQNKDMPAREPYDRDHRDRHRERDARYDDRYGPYNYPPPPPPPAGPSSSAAAPSPHSHHPHGHNPRVERAHSRERQRHHPYKR